MKQFDVLVVGELNVDVILNGIDGLPEIGKEKLASAMTVTLGSSSAIFASNLSTLGTKVVFCGKIGSDNFGMLVKTALQNKDVDISYLIQSDAMATGATIVLNYDMDRAMVTYPGAMEHLDASEIPDEWLLQAQHLHVSSIFLQPKLRTGLVQLLERARQLGLSTSLDPQWDPSEKWDLNLEQVLPLIDVFLPNRKELKLLTKQPSIEKALESIAPWANTVVVKDGENGGHIWQNGALTSQPAFLNESVADCIGAGDSFDAGYVSQFIRGQSPEDCLRFANLMGAVNTTRAGGTGAFSSLQQVRQIASTHFNQTI